jgi:ribonuclease VapC
VIVVDTSALMAIVQGEPSADACAAALATEDRIAISAGTLAEALVVAGRRNLGPAMARLIEGLGLDVLDVTESAARRIEDAYGRFGKGVHPAALNFGDCFAYEAARSQNCALLYVGEDFAHTDVASAL